MIITCRSLFVLGTNIVTNTFPQPGDTNVYLIERTKSQRFALFLIGRYSGSRLSSITCESVRRAAVLDGLVYYGTLIPKGHPKAGHFVALLISPNADYHWVRRVRFLFFLFELKERFSIRSFRSRMQADTGLINREVS